MLKDESCAARVYYDKSNDVYYTAAEKYPIWKAELGEIYLTSKKDIVLFVMYVKANVPKIVDFALICSQVGIQHLQHLWPRFSYAERLK